MLRVREFTGSPGARDVPRGGGMPNRNQRSEVILDLIDLVSIPQESLFLYNLFLGCLDVSTEDHNSD